MTNSTTTKNITRRAALGAGLGLAVGAGAASAWALDRFVVDHVEVADVAAAEQEAGTSAITADSTGSVTGTRYTSESASVTIGAVDTGALTYYVAELKLTDATRLRSAFAQNKFGENIIEVPSAIASDHDAVWAINGDYYGFRSTGIVVRNGVAYRDAGARDGLAFYRDGSVRVYDETATTAKELVSDGVWNTLSFGPSLLEDGAIAAGIEDFEVDTNVGNHSIQGSQPRTGIGVLDDNHLLAIVVDGRSSESTGVTMTEFAEIFRKLGCITAYNIDGGGSSEMIFNGDLVNNPLGRGRERGTSDILYLAK